MRLEANTEELSLYWLDFEVFLFIFGMKLEANTEQLSLYWLDFGVFVYFGDET